MEVRCFSISCFSFFSSLYSVQGCDLRLQLGSGVDHWRLRGRFDTFLLHYFVGRTWIHAVYFASIDTKDKIVAAVIKLCVSLDKHSTGFPTGLPGSRFFYWNKTPLTNKRCCFQSGKSCSQKTASLLFSPGCSKKKLLENFDIQYKGIWAAKVFPQMQPGVGLFIPDCCSFIHWE